MIKNSNALKYHLGKLGVHSNEANRMEMANTSEMEGKLKIIFTQFPVHTSKQAFAQLKQIPMCVLSKKSVLDKLLFF